MKKTLLPLICLALTIVSLQGCVRKEPIMPDDIGGAKEEKEQLGKITKQIQAQEETLQSILTEVEDLKAKLRGYDYTEEAYKDLAVDPTTKALLIKHTAPNHGACTGLGDDDHPHYFLVSGSRTADILIITDGAGHYLQVPKLTTAQRDALVASNGMIIYNTTTGQFERYEAGSWGAFAGVSTFLALTDTPASYSGQAGKILKVNATPDALEFLSFALSNLSINADKNWAGKNITNLGVAAYDVAARLAEIVTARGSKASLDTRLDEEHNEDGTHKKVTVNDAQDIKFVSGAKIERDAGHLKLTPESGKEVKLAINAKARAYRSYYIDGHQTNLPSNKNIKVQLHAVTYDPGSNFDMSTLVSGTTTGTTPDHLIDGGAAFATDGVVEGDRVKNTTDDTYAHVLAVAETDLTLDSNIFVSGENYEIKKCRFVVPIDGCYFVYGQMEYDPMVVDKRFAAMIYKNGSKISEYETHASYLEAVYAQITDIRYYDAGDYIELYGRQITGLNTVNIVSWEHVTFLVVHLLSV